MLQDVARHHTTIFPNRIEITNDFWDVEHSVTSMHYNSPVKLNEVVLKDVIFKEDHGKVKGFYTDLTGTQHDADWLVKYRQYSGR